MSLSIRATTPDGQTIERPISHFDLLKAAYGIGDSVSLRTMIIAIFTALVTGVHVGMIVMTDKPAAALVSTSVVLFLIAFHAGRTADVSHQLKILTQVMPRAPYVPELTYAVVSAAWAICAAFIALKVGGIGGFLIGLSLAILTPFARVTPMILFDIRTWNAARQARKNQKAREGIGG